MPNNFLLEKRAAVRFLEVAAARLQSYRDDTAALIARINGDGSFDFGFDAGAGVAVVRTWSRVRTGSTECDSWPCSCQATTTRTRMGTKLCTGLSRPSMG